MSIEKTTLVQLLTNGLKRYAVDEPVMATKRNGSWRVTDRETFQEKVEQLAAGLYTLGVRPGDRVSLHSENSTEWMICDLAVLSLGAVTVPIYTTQPGEQIKFILENSGAKVHIVSTDELFSETKPMMKSVSQVESVITIHGSEHRKLKHFDAILKEGKRALDKEPSMINECKDQVTPESLATIIYTSGTTGQPKGVMLSHNNISSNIQASLERVPFSLEEIPGQHVLSYLPLSHVFERMISYMYIVMGANIHYIESIEDIRDDFQQVKPYFFATVPRLLEKVQHGIKAKGQEMQGVQKRLYYWALKQAESYNPEQPPAGLKAIKMKLADKVVYSKIRELFGGELTGIISGGAPLSPEIFRFINGVGIYCGQGYGLTETSPVISVQDPGHLRTGSSGLPLSGVKVRIAEDGEIEVKGPNVMMGYFEAPDLTDESMDADGWFKTGDVGKLDEDGYLFITDRKKALFKLSTGKYVSPQPIETSLVNSGFIEQAILTGYQRKYCSALLVPAYENVRKRLKKEGVTPESDLTSDPHVRKLIQKEVDKVNGSLAKWEKIIRFALLEKPLTIENGELTPTMKVKRSVVNEKFADVIDSMYEGSESSGKKAGEE